MAQIELKVKTTKIDWINETLEVTNFDGTQHLLSLDTPIHVTMIGFPNEEEQDMLARKLGYYMERGYIIMRISFEYVRAIPEKGTTDGNI